MMNERLSEFFLRIRNNDFERLEVFKSLIGRVNFARAYDTTEDGLLVSNDGAGEYFNADTVSPWSPPLRLIVIRDSDGSATDSSYGLLEKLVAHCRKAADGRCKPDFEGLLNHAYISVADADDWKSAADDVDSAPFGIGCDEDFAFDENLNLDYEESSDLNDDQSHSRSDFDERFPCPKALGEQLEKSLGRKFSHPQILEHIKNGRFIHWEYWVSRMPVLTAAQASRLMVSLDPDIFENLEKHNRQNTSAIAACRIAKLIERLAIAQQIPNQSPAKWLEWAGANDFFVHEPFRLAVQSIAETIHKDETPLLYDDLPNQFGYTIRGAAIAISREYKVAERAMREHIFKAAEKGDLAVIDPQTGMPYTPDVRRDFYERIRIDELNKWFESCGVQYRLDEPASVSKNRIIPIENERDDASVLKRHRELHSQCNSPTKKLAEELGISDTRVRQIIARAKKAEIATSKSTVSIAGQLKSINALKR